MACEDPWDRPLSGGRIDSKFARPGEYFLNSLAATLAGPLARPLNHYTLVAAERELVAVRKISSSFDISGGSGACNVSVSKVPGCTKLISYACKACRSSRKSSCTKTRPPYIVSPTIGKPLAV